MIFSSLIMMIAVKTKAQDNLRQIRGSVTDSLSQKPLPNASVSLKNDDGINVVTIATNEKGNFNFNSVAPGNYHLSVDYLGYKRFLVGVKINSFSAPVLTFHTSLQLSGITLADVKIVSRVTKPFIISTGGKIILNVAQNPLTAGDDAYSVLLRAPGIVELNGSLIFRNKSVNVLIDDKPTHLSGDELRNMLSSLPAGSIERIEIVSNPSAKYDAQGGSVINIIFTKNKLEGFNGVFSTGVGTGRYTKYNEDISLNYRYKKINIYGNYDFLHNKQYLDLSSNRIVNAVTGVDQFSEELRSRYNNSYKIGMDYDLNERNSIGISFRGYTNYGKRTVKVQSNLIHSTLADTSSLGSTDGDVKLTNPVVNFNFNLKLDSLGKTLSFNADYLNYHKNWKDNFITDYFDVNGNRFLPTTYLRDNLPGEVTNYSFSVDYTQPSKAGKFEYGIRSQLTKSDNNLLFENKVGDLWLNDTTKSNHFIYKEAINAGYVNYTGSFAKKYTLIIGLRAEQTNTEGDLITGDRVDKKHYFNIFPNVNLNYIIGLTSELNLTYRKSIDRSGLSYVNPFLIYVNQYAYNQGNPDILPQTNHNFELTYTLKKTFIWGASYTHTVNPIAPVYINGMNNIVISTYNNLKAADLFYLYYDLTFPIAPWWTIDLSGGVGFLKYNTSSSLYKGNNATWSYLLQSENTFSFGKGWNGILNLLERGPYASGTYTLKTIFTTSTGLSKTFDNNKMAFKLSLSDIFNTEKQRVHIDYQDLIIDQVNKTETRFFNLAFTYKFGNTKLKNKPAVTPKNNDTEKRLNN